MYSMEILSRRILKIKHLSLRPNSKKLLHSCFNLVHLRHVIILIIFR